MAPPKKVRPIHAVPGPTEAEGQEPLHARLHALARRLDRGGNLDDGSRLAGVLVALGDLRHKASAALGEAADDDAKALMSEILDL